MFSCSPAGVGCGFAAAPSNGTDGASVEAPLELEASAGVP